MAHHRLTRRSFLSDLGGGVTAVAIFGLAACTSDTAATSSQAGGSDLTWQRVNLGFVSAYVLARGSEIAIVDTGTSGSEAEILNAVDALGGTWSDVDHVIATHAHGDHVGSIVAVMTAASRAEGWAGAADIANISAPRDIEPVSDGDEVFGLQVITTPGHTTGSISVFDPAAGLLIAGDALNAPGGVIEGPNPNFTQNMDLANASVQKLAELNIETLLVGHGEPVLTGAGAALRAFAETI